MKLTIDYSLFEQQFENYNRVDNFGDYFGLRALYDYLEEYEDSAGVEIALDVVGLCCEFAQYDTLQEALDEYGLQDLEELQDHTTVIEYEQGVIVQCF